MTEPAPASRTSQVLLTVALLLVITLGIRMAADLVTILVVSLVLTLLTLPAVGALDRRGIPRGVAVAIVSLGAFLLLLGLVGLLVYALHVLVTDIGFFQAELDRRSRGSSPDFSMTWGSTRLRSHPRRSTSGPSRGPRSVMSRVSATS